MSFLDKIYHIKGNVMDNLVVKAQKRRFDFKKFFDHLKGFYKKFGHLNVKQDYVINGYPLGLKISLVRRGKVKLNDEQIKMLNDLGFIWDAKTFDFEKFYENLKLFYKTYGHLNVNQSYTINGYPLGRKIHSLRSGSIKLNSEQIKMLVGLGFIWNVNDYKFKLFYNYLKGYYEEFGNLDIKISFVINGYPLGMRLNSIRNGNIKLNDEQIKMLNDLGFIWDAKTFDFEKFYENLKLFYKTYGHLNVNQSYTINGYPLGRKIHSLRSGSIKLNSEQIKSLDDLGFIWNVNDYKFKLFYNHLKIYYKVFGNLDIKISYVINGYPLGKRLGSVRSGLIKLSDKQIKMLNDLGFIWNKTIPSKIKDFDFNEFIDTLKKIEKFENNLIINHDLIINNYEVGFYTKCIRMGYIKISNSQKKSLIDIGFVFDTHPTYFASDNYSTTDSSSLLLSRINQGDMLARKVLCSKLYYLVDFIAKKEDSLVDWTDLRLYLSEQLMKILDLLPYKFDKTRPIDAYVYACLKNFKIKFYNKLPPKEISIYSTISNNEGLTIESHLKANEEENPDVLTINKTFNNELISKLESLLTKSEFKLICRYFGLQTKKLSIAELSQKYNVSEVKVKKAIIRIIDKLKSNLDENEWNI